MNNILLNLRPNLSEIRFLANLSRYKLILSLIFITFINASLPASARFTGVRSSGFVNPAEITTGSANKLPLLVGQSSGKGNLYLPRDLKAKYNFILFNFVEQANQKLAANWAEQIENLFKGNPEVAYLEAKIYPPENTFKRFYKNNLLNFTKENHSIASFYLHIPSLKDTLAIPKDTKLCLLVLNPEGDVMWRTTGAADAYKTKQLREFINY
jgi:hypothetical protein